MKYKCLIYITLILLYSFLYKIYFFSYGELFQYIINPLIWMLFSFYVYTRYYTNDHNYFKYEKLITYKAISASLVYIILFYNLGYFIGYSNTPYSKSLNGIIINLFSILLIVSLKEYIRGNLIIFVGKKKLYIFIITLIFILTDLNILGILDEISNNNNLFLIFAKYIVSIISINIFCTYLCLNSRYVPSLIYRTIITFFTLIIPIVPKYDHIIIILFDLLIPLFTYLIIKYEINKRNKRMKETALKPGRWIVIYLLTIFLLMFSLGVFHIRPISILTGSMRPSINEGDLLIIKKCVIDEVNIDDIIQFKVNDYSVVHRVVNIIVDNNNIYNNN